MVRNIWKDTACCRFFIRFRSGDSFIRQAKSSLNIQGLRSYPIFHNLDQCAFTLYWWLLLWLKNFLSFIKLLYFSLRLSFLALSVFQFYFAFGRKETENLIESTLLTLSSTVNLGETVFYNRHSFDRV